jgi:hypothetical protein
VYKKSVRGALAALLVLMTVPAVTTAAAPTTAVVASGVLTDKVGHGTRGIVYALAWPGEDLLRTLQPGDTIEAPVVGSADTDEAGSFSLVLDDKTIPNADRRRDGGLNLLLVGTDGTFEAMLFQPAPSPAQVVGIAASASARAASDVTLKMDLRLPKEGPRATSSSGGKLTPNAAPPPLGYPCGSWSLQSTRTVWASVGQSYSGPATNYATLDLSNSISNGTAISASGAYGSWTSSGSQTLTTGLTKTWTENLTDRDFQAQFVYGTYKALCQFGYNRYAFTPSYGTGGDQTPAAVNYPARNYCTSITAGLWTRSSGSGSSYSESVGVKASGYLGINLGVTHSYSGATNTRFTLSYRPSSTVTICGDTDYPALARKPRI